MQKLTICFAALATCALACGVVQASVLYVSNEQTNGTISQVSSNGSVTTFGSGLIDPTGIAFDASGNLYVANYSANTISKITPAGAISTFASGGGIDRPEGLAFDSFGNLYVANLYAPNSTSTISKITPNGTVSLFATGLQPTDGSSPSLFGLAFGPNGNLYATSPYDNAITMITPSGVVGQFVSNVPGAFGLAIDRNGNLYTSSGSNDSITKITPTGSISTFASGIGISTGGLAIDGNGDLFSANSYDNSISEIMPDGTVTPFASGLDNPSFMAVQDTSAVPEPSTFVIGLAFSFCILRRFRRSFEIEA